MDTLPVETVRHIFKLACTDGGPTGNALSLTSKGIRAASRPIRFHSLALIANPRRLRAFITLYARECAALLEDKPRIHHLHLTFPNIYRNELEPRYRRSLSPPPRRRRNHESGLSQSQTEESPSSGQRDDVLEEIDDWRLRGAPISEAYEEYLADARMLFDLVATDVRTLVIQAGFTYGGELTDLHCIERPLTALRELTFVSVEHPCALFQRSGSNSDGPGTTVDTPLFPSLTHLRILHLFWPGSSREYNLPQWARHAPRVWHLHLTGLGFRHIREVAEAVGVWYPGHGDWDHSGGRATLGPSTPAYPSVRVLVLRPPYDPVPPSRLYCSLGSQSPPGGVYLEDVVERCNRGTNVEAVLLEAGYVDGMKHLTLADDIRREWIAGMDY
ncbi:hypothetical protein C8Q77DRAFT_1157926 [Trametes polyzona]|nr:hypothetical protein C8Q77DRAFT_1157926 [Trametes polyzona]